MLSETVLGLVPFANLVFNLGTFLLGCTGCAIGLLIRSIARAQPQQDMLLTKNENRPSVKMAIIFFLGSAVCLGIAAQVVFIRISIAGEESMDMPLFPFLIFWLPTFALLCFFAGRSQLNPAKQIPARMVWWLCLLLAASVIAIFCING